jgi:hypothetical protein
VALAHIARADEADADRSHEILSLNEIFSGLNNLELSFCLWRRESSPTLGGKENHAGRWA